MTGSPETIPLIEILESQRGLGILSGDGPAGKVTFPLAGVDIQCRVIERVASVTVKQVFKNSFTEHLEAVYIFPLAAGCAVASFNMKVGDRVVKGIVQERAQARQNYQQALDSGKRAALMEQERDDVFTVQVGNIPPGEEITVEITYSEKLPFFDNGQTELRLPLVVSPRYIPGNVTSSGAVGAGTESDTDLVPDASRITPPRLAEGVNSGVALSCAVVIETDPDGGMVSNFACSQHATKLSMESGDLKIELAKANERLNRDFVLRWNTASKDLKTSLVAFKDNDGQCYGMLSIIPPAREGYLGAPRDIVFVVDRSGSMGGVKMTSAARACSILANTLGDRDRLAVLAFDNYMEWMPTPHAHTNQPQRFIKADTQGIEKVEQYLRTITARGGTELDRAIEDALVAVADRSEIKGRTVSLVVLTDGEVGNESQILSRIQRCIGDTRVFAVGIDTSVNSGLLKRLANLGGGTATFVEPGVQLEEALASVGREIGQPLASDLQVDGVDLAIDRASISPSRIPDAFAGRASVAFFKLSNAKGKVTVKGRYGDGKPFELKVKCRRTDMQAVAQLWAKTRIVDLEDQFRISGSQRKDLKDQIVALSVKHSLLTKFTAFVVVDEAEIVNKTGDMQQMVQPVEMPDQWEMQAQGLAPMAASMSNASWGTAAPAPKASRSQQMPSRRKQSASDEMLATSTRLRSLSRIDTPPSQPPAPGSGGNNISKKDTSPLYEADPANAGWGDLSSAESDQCEWGAVSGCFQSAPAPEKREPQICFDRAYEDPHLQELRSSISPAPAAQPASTPAQAPTPPLPPAKERADSESQSGACGSYGAGVRSQVFEVIVRQALGGAPWRTICAGPMQVNNISEQEVEAEVKRRQNLLGQPKGAWEQIKEFGKAILGHGGTAAPAIPKEEARQLKAILAETLRLYTEAFIKVENGDRPDSGELERTRQKLVQKLATLSLGMSLPCLQKFLRSMAIELIQSLNQSNIDMADLQKFWSQARPEFDAALAETGTVLETALDAQDREFWEASV